MWYHPEVQEDGWYPEVAQVQTSWGKGAYTGGNGEGDPRQVTEKGSPEGKGKGKGPKKEGTRDG